MPAAGRATAGRRPQAEPPPRARHRVRSLIARRAPRRRGPDNALGTRSATARPRSPEARLHLIRLAALLVLGVAVAAQAADPARGRVLYETRCTGCHDSSVHGRTKRTADSCAAIRAEVVRWNRNTGGTWSDDEIDDVTLWLNERYYRFPVDNGRCVTPVASITPARLR